jgi:hypothetical protein
MKRDIGLFFAVTFEEDGVFRRAAVSMFVFAVHALP